MPNIPEVQHPDSDLGKPEASTESVAATGQKSYEELVAARVLQRREKGLAKYGVGVERDDLTALDWLQHAQEEALDLAVYLERLKAEYSRAEHISDGKRR